MNTSNIFTKDNEKVINLFFAIKLNVKASGIRDNELKDVFKLLRKKHKKYFKKSNHYYKREASSGVILDQRDSRDIVVGPRSIQYHERKYFDNKTYNNICQLLYDFYINIKGVEPEDIKVIGKVFELEYDIQQNVIEHLQGKTGLLSDKDVSDFEIRTTFKESEKNIHLWIRNTQSDDDSDWENKIWVKVDINNVEQEDGLQENSFKEIFDFADNFVENRLIDTLNKNFG